jgi:hypothetical protein
LQGAVDVSGSCRGCAARPSCGHAGLRAAEAKSPKPSTGLGALFSAPKGMFLDGWRGQAISSHAAGVATSRFLVGGGQDLAVCRRMGVSFSDPYHGQGVLTSPDGPEEIHRCPAVARTRGTCQVSFVLSASLY